MSTLLTLLPLWYQLLLVAVLGAVMASFINVLVYRLHTNVSIGGRSHCLSCGSGLRWFELVPIMSYCLLRGRCRTCHVRIPSRDFVVELIGSASYVLVFWFTSSLILVPVLWFLMTILLAIALYDLEHYIIPDELTLLVAGIGVGVMSYAAWPLSVVTFVDVLLATLIAAGAYVALWLYSGGRWLGFGDVKLAAALGLFLTLEQAFSMVVFSFWIGAIVGLLLVYGPALRRRLQTGPQPSPALSLKSEIPFAPFIVVAFLVVYIYELSVLRFF